MCKYNEVSETLVYPTKAPAKRPRKRLLDTLVNNAVHLTKKELENHAQTVQNNRLRLFSLRRIIGENYKRVRPCGRNVINRFEGVKVAKSDKSVFYGGLQSCASVWACPVCSMKINQRRSDEVRDMLTNAIIAQGNKGMFITLTLPHTKSEKLKALQDLVTESWRELTADVRYKGQYRTKNKVSYLAKEGLKQRFGIKGFIRAMEVKKGANGWHPHLHIAFVMEAKYHGLALFAEDLIRIWTEIVNRRSGKKARRRAQDWKEIHDIAGIADYTVKWDVARELVTGHTKERGEGLTPFQLMDKYQETADKTYLNDFLAYALSMEGVKQLTFSQDFKKMFLVSLEEKTDEEICRTETVERVLLRMETKLFRALHAFKEEINFLNLVQFRPDLIPDFLSGLLEVYNAAPPGEVPYFRLYSLAEGIEH